MVLQFLNCVPNWVKCIPSLRLAQAVDYEGCHSSTLLTHHPIITSQRWLNGHALSSLELSKPDSPKDEKCIIEFYRWNFELMKSLQD